MLKDEKLRNQCQDSESFSTFFFIHSRLEIRAAIF